MPTYVYECRDCAQTFEVQQRIIEDSLTDCILCESKGSVKRVIQPIAVMFKGSGFHINDYADKKVAPESEKKDDNSPKPEKVEAKADVPATTESTPTPVTPSSAPSPTSPTAA
jgi:putative FmdB family regulatory protein